MSKAKKAKPAPADQAARVVKILAASTEEYRVVPLVEISTSPNNPRKTFDPDKLEELAESIRRHGVAEPILVRRTVGGFELVAGERRLRASKLAGLEGIPAIVREMSDEQADELRLVENIQREDLTPIEEALALARLRDTLGYTPERIAEQLGKKVRAVYQRLQLVRLDEPVREAVATGALDFSMALEVAQVSDPRAQRELADLIVKGNQFGQRLSTVKAARDYRKEHLQRSLSKTPFKLKEDGLAGKPSCLACPSNTSNFPKELEAPARMCTNPSCFREKAVAMVERAAAGSDRQHVLSESQVKKLFPYEHSDHVANDDFKDLDVGFPHSWSTPLVKQIGEETVDGVEVYYAVRSSGVVRRLIKTEDAKRLLKSSAKPTEETKRSKEEEKRKEREKRDKVLKTAQKAARAEGVRLVVAAAAEKPDPERVFRPVCAALLGSYWQAYMLEIFERRGVFVAHEAAIAKMQKARDYRLDQNRRDWAEAFITAMPAAECVMLAYELSIGRAAEPAYADKGAFGARFLAAAADVGVDVDSVAKKLEGEALAEFDAKIAKKRAAEAAKQAKAKQAKKAASAEQRAAARTAKRNSTAPKLHERADIADGLEPLQLLEDRPPEVVAAEGRIAKSLARGVAPDVADLAITAGEALDSADAECLICGCTESSPCPAGCQWYRRDGLMVDVCTFCAERVHDEVLERAGADGATVDDLVDALNHYGEPRPSVSAETAPEPAPRDADAQTSAQAGGTCEVCGLADSEEFRANNEWVDDDRDLCVECDTLLTPTEISTFRRMRRKAKAAKSTKEYGRLANEVDRAVEVAKSEAASTGADLEQADGATASAAASPDARCRVCDRNDLQLSKSGHEFAEPTICNECQDLLTEDELDGFTDSRRLVNNLKGYAKTTKGAELDEKVFRAKRAAATRRAAAG